MKQTITIDREPYEVDRTVAGAIERMQTEIDTFRNALVSLAVFVGGEPCWCRCDGGKHSQICREMLKLKLWARVCKGKPIGRDFVPWK